MPFWTSCAAAWAASFLYWFCWLASIGPPLRFLKREAMIDGRGGRCQLSTGRRQRKRERAPLLDGSMNGWVETLQPPGAACRPPTDALCDRWGKAEMFRKILIAN